MDPLKPLTSLVRSLRASRKAAASQSQSQRPADGPAPDAVAPIASIDALHSRLRPRLAALPAWDRARARELFVESILLTELGDDLARDPGFTELIHQVSRHLGNEPEVSARLDHVLQDLARET